MAQAQRSGSIPTRAKDDDAVVVDCHNDLMMSVIRRGMLGDAVSFKHRWIPELRAGGWINASGDTVFTDHEGDILAFQTQTYNPGLKGVPVGAHPDAFALSPDGRWLFVALAGMNAVEVLDGHTGLRPGGAPRYIPTGWYPSALTVTGNPGQYRLWVANAKGNGPGPGGNGSVLFDGTQTGGTVNVVDLPASSKDEAFFS